jgi:aryl-alcohol dehydrogenase
MKTRTRAAVVHRQGGAFTFEEIELDDPRPDEVLVRIVACGVCHTDIAARDGLFSMELPAVFGHEGAGIVESVGKDVSRVRAGDTVVLSFSSCGECSGCRKGRPARCRAFEELNFGSRRTDGSPTIRDAASGAPIGGCFFGQSSFSYYSLARQSSLIPIDTEDEEELAMLAPLGCGIQAGAGTVLNELGPQPGDSIAIFGVGAVGMSALMAARLAGATRIVAVDIVPSRLELARELGAAFTINGRTEDVGSRLMEYLGEVDHAVETTGNSRMIDLAVRSLASHGNLSMLGVSTDGEGERISPASPGPHQRVFYSIAGDSDPQKFIPFLIDRCKEGKFPFNKLTREYAASQINEAVKDSLEGSTIKPVLRFRT